ncbi:DUF342 domain-containing protein [Amphibacillus sp. Q70]|uniref:DUF342 domain-containing protein n=1 Tax=Amphibacillus sp. Q70 TaxID=3453416 RepID=UPI003F834DA5
MLDLNDHFIMLISEDQMAASIQLIEDYNVGDITEQDIKDWLKSKKVIFGLNEESIKKITDEFEPALFPIKIAQGEEPEHGIDGTIDFVCDRDDYFNIDEKRDFRDIKRIPSLEEHEKIAVITDPIQGKAGYTVFGKKRPFKKARPVKMKAGKNVIFNKEENTFYATVVGKLSVTGQQINVHDTYEINEDLSMKTGNINFVGSVIIRGNVPAGYRVEAEGDIHIYGLVEAGFIKAAGNVTITEGIAGLKKGTIDAGGDVKIGYINQAKVEAENNIIVQNSIMHSHCVAKEHIYCHSGSIIGGVCSAGVTIQANEVGNKMDTKTEISIGVDQEQFQQESQLNVAKKTLLNEINKLKKLGDNLERKAKTSHGLSSKERILLLKQKNTMQVTKGKLAKIEEQIESLKVQIGDENKARLIVKKAIYPNVDLRFGKYQKTTDTIYKYTQVYIEEGEIEIKSL